MRGKRTGNAFTTVLKTNINGHKLFKVPLLYTAVYNMLYSISLFTFLLPKTLLPYSKHVTEIATSENGREEKRKKRKKKKKKKTGGEKCARTHILHSAQ